MCENWEIENFPHSHLNLIFSQTPQTVSHKLQASIHRGYWISDYQLQLAGYSFDLLDFKIEIEKCLGENFLFFTLVPRSQGTSKFSTHGQLQQSFEKAKQSAIFFSPLNYLIKSISVATISHKIN
jgi:hypothetical protein